MNRNYVAVLLIVGGLIAGCGKSDTEKLKESIELEKAKIELQAVKREEEIKQKTLREEEQRKTQAVLLEQEAKAKEEQFRVNSLMDAANNQNLETQARKKAVEDLEASFRLSLMDGELKGTRVLRLRNGSDRTAEFVLKCYTVNSEYKKFPLVIATGETKEIGWAEGWSGNFVSGEKCEALYDGSAIWNIKAR